MFEKLCLGTAQFGMQYGVANKSGIVSNESLDEIIKLARISGVNTIDTAALYGNVEQRLGRAGISDWQVVSKLRGVESNNTGLGLKEWLNNELGTTLTNLNISNLYGYLLHRPMDLTSNEGSELYRFLLDSKHQGKIEKIGYSVYSIDELEILLSKYPPDLIQIPLNILDRKLVNSGWASKLKDLGIEIHTRSAFLQGLLLMSESDRPEKFNHWNSLWVRWTNWLKTENISAMEACLQFVYSIQEVDKFVIGIDQIEQLKEILSIQPTKMNFPIEIESTDKNLIYPFNWVNL